MKCNGQYRPFPAFTKRPDFRHSLKKMNNPHQVGVWVPGKCLLTGGYLVLEEWNRGVSVSLSAKTHATLSVEDEESEIASIQVTSPDLGGKWVYSVDSTRTMHIIEFTTL